MNIKWLIDPQSYILIIMLCLLSLIIYNITVGVDEAIQEGISSFLFVSDNILIAIIAVLMSIVLWIIHCWGKTTPSTPPAENPTPTPPVPPKDEKDKDKGKKTEGKSVLTLIWEAVKKILVWVAYIALIISAIYLFHEIVFVKLQVVKNSVNDFIDHKNRLTRQDSTDNDKKLDIDPAKLEKILQSTSTAEPKPGEIWILTWDRCDIKEKDDVASDTKVLIKQYKIITWSKEYLKFEREYLSKKGKKEKIIFEWDKSKNPKYGTWQEVSLGGPFELSKAMSGGYSGWIGERKSIYRIPIWFRKKQ